MFFWTRPDYDLLVNMLGHVITQQQQTQALLTQVLKQEKNVMSALDDLQSQVNANTNLEQSAITLIQGIAKQLSEAINNNDSAALQQLASQLQSSAAALGSAIAANTPAADPNAPQVNPLSAKHR
jgi:hypothetical protein